MGALKRITWPQAVVAIAAMVVSGGCVVFGPENTQLLAAGILGSAVTAGVGAFRGG